MRSIVNTIRIIFIPIGGIFVFYSIWMAGLFPNNLGSYLPGLFGIFVIFYGMFRNKLISLSKKGPLKAVRIIVRCGISFVFISFAIICSMIYVNALHVPEAGKDAVIVLGAGLKGSQVSITLSQRLRKAKEYYGENPESIIVVSGGQGADEFIPEALAMKNYLVEIGVNENSILMEDKSTSTKENFLFSKQMLEDYFDGQTFTTVFVTNDFHALRAGYYADKAGLDTEPLSCETLAYMLPSYYSREYLALLYYYVFESSR